MIDAKVGVIQTLTHVKFFASMNRIPAGAISPRDGSELRSEADDF